MVSGYVMSITVYNPSCNLLNIFYIRHASCLRPYSMVVFRSGSLVKWLRVRDRARVRVRARVGPGNAMLPSFFFFIDLTKCDEHLGCGSLLWIFNKMM